MKRVVLITGGARSGKSAFAEKLASASGGRKAYIATAPVMDAEMAARVEKHRTQRAGEGWATIEEQLDPAEKIKACSGMYDVVLVDCLTLWINNLMYHSDLQGEAMDETEMKKRCDGLKSACGDFGGVVIFVINEVGLGIVPDNPLSRRFRDLSGRCSQSIAQWADQVTLVCCGLPLHLKNQ